MKSKWFVKCDDGFIETCAVEYVGRNVTTCTFEKYLYLRFHNILEK